MENQKVTSTRVLSGVGSPRVNVPDVQGPRDQKEATRWWLRSVPEARKREHKGFRILINYSAHTHACIVLHCSPYRFNLRLRQQNSPQLTRHHYFIDSFPHSPVSFSSSSDSLVRFLGTFLSSRFPTAFRHLVKSAPI